MKTLNFLKYAFMALSMSLTCHFAMAAEPINTLKNSSLFARPTGIAINGYDAVAYINNNKATPGEEKFTFEWQGAKWRFANMANLDAFKANPSKYAPQYGGYCAYGVTKGQLVKVDPEQFSVIDGKLYLNYDAGVQKDWLKNKQEYIEVANKKFPDLLKK